ncbi:MAG: cupin, partial [Alphaproteobacteria bacterium]
PVWLAYVNPETGMECLPVLGFSAFMVRAGETVRTARRSCSAVAHVIEGEGEADVDGTTLVFGENDTFVLPTHSNFTVSNGSGRNPLFLFVVDDAPLQRKLGFYEEFPAA